tara:strand:- start:77655 stop:78326 length:672 start_codon:yes stop_codon:yes gene_type:complete
MILMGHRGARDELPENSLLGFQKVIDKGLKAIELDIHLSSDGHIVVIHDETLDRTSNGCGLVKEKTLAQLKELDLGSEQRIPTLKEALDVIVKSKVEVQIEIKTSEVLEKLPSELSEYDSRYITVISFDHKALKTFKESCPHIKTACLLYGLPVDPISIIKSCHADGISLSTSLIDKEIVERCHQENYSVTSWNANDLETINKFKKMGVDYLGTDLPLKFFGL